VAKGVADDVVEGAADQIRVTPHRALRACLEPHLTARRRGLERGVVDHFGEERREVEIDDLGFGISSLQPLEEEQPVDELVEARRLAVDAVERLGGALPRPVARELEADRRSTGPPTRADRSPPLSR